MKAKLQEAVKSAMKERDRVKADAIRSVLAAIQYEEMQKKVDDLPADAIIAVLQREVKKRKEEIEFAEKASRNDVIEKVNLELKVIETFLPKQLSRDELVKVVTELKGKIANVNMGLVMKELQGSYGGQYDGKMASEVVKQVLSA